VILVSPHPATAASLTVEVHDARRVPVAVADALVWAAPDEALVRLGCDDDSPSGRGARVGRG
jgi:hypothetical protein